MYLSSNSRPGSTESPVSLRAPDSIREKALPRVALLHLASGISRHRWFQDLGLLPLGAHLPPAQEEAPKGPWILNRDFKRRRLGSITLLQRLPDPPELPNEAGLKQTLVRPDPLTPALCRGARLTVLHRRFLLRTHSSMGYTHGPC